MGDGCCWNWGCLALCPMKAIAGRLGESPGVKLQGTIEYAGLRLQEKPQPKGGIKLVKLVGYVDSGPLDSAGDTLLNCW